MVATQWDHGCDVDDIFSVSNAVRDTRVDGILSSEDAVKASARPHHDFESSQFILVIFINSLHIVMFVTRFFCRLIFALFGKITGMTERLGQIKDAQENKTTSTSQPLPAQKFTTSKSFPTQLPETTVESITESVFSRITEIVNQTAAYPTENYDYSNTNYFDTDEDLSEAKSSTSTTVETSSAQSFFNFTDFTEPYYIDNDSYNMTDFFSNSSGDLFENSNFNMSNLINSSVFNDSFMSNFTDTALNYTSIEPIASAYQSFLKDEPLFINMDMLNISTKLELRKLCWETMFGQELVKLTVMDLVRETRSKFSVIYKNFRIKFPSAPYGYANNASRFLSRAFCALHELVLVLGFRKTFPEIWRL